MEKRLGLTLSITCLTAPKDGTKHKVLLNLNTEKREEHEDGIPKVFDYLSDPDSG